VGVRRTLPERCGCYLHDSSTPERNIRGIYMNVTSAGIARACG
jgi:hypothetical protein